MRAIAARIGPRENGIVLAVTPLRIRFSAAAFLVALLVQTAAIPATGFAASAYEGVEVHLMMGGNPGDSAVRIFIAQWWYVGLIFAGPLAVAGVAQRKLMNRMGWTGARAFALLGIVWGTAWSFLAFHAGIAGLRDGWPLEAQALFLACLAPFALAHALLYRAVGGVEPRV
jgi:hypothetical protein